MEMQRDAVGLGRHDHLVEQHRRPVDAEHARDRESPDVGVDYPDALAAPREGDRQIGGDRRLAHAALARRDQQHPRARGRIGEGDGAALGMAVGRLRPGA
jgi:hypothetical protein